MSGVYPDTKQAQFIKSETASDLPIMIEKIDPKDWREFFKNEARKLKRQIVK